MFIFAGIFVFSAVQLLLIFGEYKQGSSEYEKLAEEYVQFEEKRQLTQESRREIFRRAG